MAPKFLSEYESKKLLAGYGIPMAREILAGTKEEALAAASRIGYPVVIKGSGEKLTHKTELGLVRVGLMNERAVAAVIDDWEERGIEGLEGFLVQEVVSGKRELICGLSQDAQFGPVVMFGLGGIAAEVTGDVVFRVCPIAEGDALEMIGEIRAAKVLDEFRGEPPVDRKALAKILLGISQLAVEREDVEEIDINPVLISGDRPVAVDALVGLKG